MTTYKTGNPLGSVSPKDLFDNSENLDCAVNGAALIWKDRFDGSRLSWAGIEDRARIDVLAAAELAAREATAQAAELRDQAQVARDDAREARDDAIAAASASGEFVFAETYADALGKLPLSEGAVVEVGRDETLDESRTRYVVEGNQLRFAVNLDLVRIALAQPNGAEIVGFRRPESTAVRRNLLDRGNDTISVLDYIDTPVDGETSNQNGIAAAVAAAEALGADLVWPATEGDYISTDNIPGFNSVRHLGPGVISRGTDRFYISPQGPGVRNSFYYSPTGSDSNDGLSADMPRQTLSDVAQVLNHWSGAGSMQDGRWRFLFSAGEWVDQTLRINCRVDSKYPVEFEGVIDSSSVPTSIWRHTSSSAFSNVVWIEPGGEFSFRNLYFKGVDNTQFASYGIIQKQGGRLSCYDCRVEGKSIGFAVVDSVKGYFARCWAVNCQDGFRVSYQCTGTIGDAEDTLCRALNCTNTGAFISRNGTAHVDYFNPEDCLVGVFVDMGARAACVAGNYKRCSVGVRTQGSGEFTDGGINFNTGTPDACLITFQSQGSGGEIRLYSQTSQMEHRAGCDVGSWSVSGPSYSTLTNIVDYNGTRLKIPKGWFVDSKKTIRLKIWGEKIGTAGNKFFRFMVLNHADQSNPQTLLTANLGNAAGAFIYEILVTSTGVNSQQTDGELLSSSGTSILRSSGGVSFSAADRMLRLYGMTEDAGDSIAIRRYEVTLLG
ncbi:hypothetical protein NBV64_09180 [Alcaligenes sp. DN25]|uniref:hypothetical protein n=1 Tax=Alcaligenes TaxID=507 RepID=UPI00202EC9BF|nr:MULTISPECIES: hypothetical protein [Alcaligenes]URW84500.1 hypothetical protein NBV64_09180 [Alcaligenes sp. DN25]WEA69341.1 hypothetical protein PWH35_09205 [Alcaligenes faecalis]